MQVMSVVCQRNCQKAPSSPSFLPSCNTRHKCTGPLPEGASKEGRGPHADNGDGQQYEADQNLEGYDEYQMRFSNRESSRPGELDSDPIYKTQIRNGGQNIARGRGGLKDTFLQGSNRTDISSLGQLDPSQLSYHEFSK